MKVIDIIEKLRKVNGKIQMLIFSERPIPNDLKLEHNKLMNDYDEQLEIEKNGKPN